MATKTHKINEITFTVHEVVEVEELTTEKWMARIVAFKKDSGHVILTDIKRTQYGGHIWRDEKLIRKIAEHSSTKRPRDRKHLPTY